MRGIVEFRIRTAVSRSAFRAPVETGKCVDCGTCLDRCQLGALSLSDGTAHIDPNRCAGCGLCVTTCSVEALQLERRPEDEVQKPPATIHHWMRDRAEARGISMDAIV